MPAKSAILIALLFAALSISGIARADALSDLAAADSTKDRGDYDQAIQLYTRAINSAGGLDPVTRCAIYNNRGWALLLRASSGGGQPDFERSLADFNEAIRLSPQQWQPYHNRATAYRALNQDDRASADRNQAIRINADGVRKFEALTAAQVKTYSSDAVYPAPPPSQPQQQSGFAAPRSSEPSMADRMTETLKRQRRENCESWLRNPNRGKFSNPCS